MPKTQKQLNTALDAAVKDYTGNHVAYQGEYRGECVSLVKQVYHDVGIDLPPTGTGWGDGWYKTKPSGITKFFRVEKFVSGKKYPKGTIISYSTHHVAIVMESSGGSTTKVFQQNANPDGSAARVYSRSNSNANGVLVPIVAAEPVAKTINASVVSKTVHLSAKVSSWRVYKVGSVSRPFFPRKPVGELNPAKYGGLSYRILAVDKAPNSVVIETKDFGKVSLPVDRDATIS